MQAEKKSAIHEAQVEWRCETEKWQEQLHQQPHQQRKRKLSDYLL
jgi:hypothetical protein